MPGKRYRNSSSAGGRVRVNRGRRGSVRRRTSSKKRTSRRCKPGAYSVCKHNITGALTHRMGKRCGNNSHRYCLKDGELKKPRNVRKERTTRRKKTTKRRSKRVVKKRSQNYNDILSSRRGISVPADYFFDEPTPVQIYPEYVERVERMPYQETRLSQQISRLSGRSPSRRTSFQRMREENIAEQQARVKRLESETKVLEKQRPILSRTSFPTFTTAQEGKTPAYLIKTEGKATDFD